MDTVTGDAQVEKPHGTSALRRQRLRFAWLFVAPTLITIAVIGAWPLAQTVWLSFTDATLGAVRAPNLIGFENYALLLGDPEWWNAVRNTFVFAVCSVTLETVLGIAIALVLNAEFRGRGLVRAAVLVPWAIPLVVSGKMWAWMYNDQFGVINEILMDLGVIGRPIAWLADPDLAMAAVIATDVWKTTPFMVILILAALQMVPKALYEAARLDGIHPVKVFFRITLPLIRPVLVVAIIFRSLDALRVFDLIYVMTSNSRDTASMSVFARQQLINFADLGYGSAASFLIFVIVAVVTLIYVKVGRVWFGNELR